MTILLSNRADYYLIDAIGIALDRNRMIWTYKLDLLFFHVSVFPF